MPLTNPWLAGPAPEATLPRAQLEERILILLSTHNMAVIATVNDDSSPAATPVHFYSLGFEIFYTSWNASVKSRNLRRDPRVSAGIFASLVGQASSRGAQLFGTARTLERDDIAASRYWEAVRWQSDHVERGRSLDEPPTDPLTVITPSRILLHRALATTVRRLCTPPDVAPRGTLTTPLAGESDEGPRSANHRRGVACLLECKSQADILAYVLTYSARRRASSGWSYKVGRGW